MIVLDFPRIAMWSLLAGLAAGDAHAADPVDECRRLAGSVEEPNNKERIGVDLPFIDTSAATTACDEAARLNPQDHASEFRRARAYMAPGPRQDIRFALYTFSNAGGLARRNEGTIGKDVSDWYRQAARTAVTPATYEKAAKVGDVEAQLVLAFLHQEPRFGALDEAKSEKWMKAAAEQGNSKAQWWMGQKAEPRGEFEKAREWYQLAADQNDPSGYFSIAMHYKLGKGVPENRAEADRLFEIAAELGSKTAAEHLETAAHSRRERSLMADGKTIVVPADYTEPDEREIGLAFMRAYAQYGKQTGFRSFTYGLFADTAWEIEINGMHKDGCVKGGQGYTCAFVADLTYRRSSEMISALGNTLQGQVMSSAADMMTRNGSKRQEEVFILGPEGWYSPTLRIQAQRGMVAAMGTVAEALGGVACGLDEVSGGEGC